MNSTVALKTLQELTPTLSAGILTANLLSLGAEISLLEQAGVKVVHFDVMDGCFTPMMTVGPPLIRAVRTPMLKDVHLMIHNPLTTLADYANAGADILTVHVEAGIHVHRVLQEMAQLKNRTHPDSGLVRGVALNPGTPVEVIEPLLEEVELVTLLAVNPGWGGQQFIKSTPARLIKARELIRQSGKNVLLGVDGGVTRANITEVAAMGADLIVTGSAIFDGKAAADNARFMLSRLARTG